MSNKYQVLETITAVARIITLVFKPKGTKIAIRDHNIVLCEPNPSKFYGLKIAQGLDRYINGDSREDIYVLNRVICNFIELYITPSKQMAPDMYSHYINLAQYLRLGLITLQETYKSGTVVGTLQYFIIVLTAIIDNTYYPEMLYNRTISRKKSFLDDSSSQDTQDNNKDNVIYSTIFDIDKFKNFWTQEEILSLCTQLESCFKNPIKKKERRDSNISDNSYEINDDDIEEQEDNNKYATPKSTSNLLVQGYLLSISNILDIMDKRFTTILEQSVKGSN